MAKLSKKGGSYFSNNSSQREHFFSKEDHGDVNLNIKETKLVRPITDRMVTSLNFEGHFNDLHNL